jgi:hypothetical protein
MEICAGRRRRQRGRGPCHRLTGVTNLAATVVEREDAIANPVVFGETIAAARVRYGYHTLQRGVREIIPNGPVVPQDGGYSIKWRVVAPIARVSASYLSFLKRSSTILSSAIPRILATVSIG